MKKRSHAGKAVLLPSKNAVFLLRRGADFNMRDFEMSKNIVEKSKVNFHLHVLIFD